MESIWEVVLSVITSYKFYIPVLTVCLAVIIIKLSKRFVKKAINKESKTLEVKRKNTIISLLQNIIKYVIIIFSFVIILGVWGVDVSGIIAGLGIVGVVGGLAIQDALKDIIMGINIIMDNFFVVGDIITYNDFTGEVIEFGLKNTKIKNVEGTVLVVSNRNISEIQNISKKNASVVVTIPTSYKEKDSKVEKVLKRICETIDTWELSTEKTEYLGLDSLNTSSVDYIIRAHCTASNKHPLRRKILVEIKREFDKCNMQIPFTQIEVHNGKDI